MKRSKEIKTVRHFIIEGKEYLEDEVPEEERNKIYQELACRAMEAVGFRPVQKEWTA